MIVGIPKIDIRCWIFINAFNPYKHWWLWRDPYKQAIKIDHQKIQRFFKLFLTNDTNGQNDVKIKRAANIDPKVVIFKTRKILKIINRYISLFSERREERPTRSVTSSSIFNSTRKLLSNNNQYQQKV